MIVRQYAPCSLGRSIICLGKQGEINALRVEFDVSAWMAMYPDATVKLMHFAPDRPQDNPVIPTLGVEGTLRVWIVGEEDTAGAGNGVIELLLIDERTGSTIKSATGYTTVLRSPSAGIEAQEAEAGYVRYDVDQSALLTDEQKAVARKNIGAGTGDDTGSGGILKETDPTVPAWAKQPSKPTYTAGEVGARPDSWTPSASEVGADAAGTASGAVAAHNVSGAAHADLRALIEGLNNRLNALADSDDTTLDQLSEIVAYIKSNRTLIDAVTTGKVSVSDIVDNLTTNASGKVLSAAQGVALKAMIDGIVIPTALPNPQAITINGQRYDGSEAVEVNVAAEGGGATVELDTTLTQSGKAADAKVVGDKLSELNAANAKQDERLTTLEQAGGIVTVEPAQDDVPIVFFGGDLPQTKTDTVMPFKYVSKTKTVNGYAKAKAQGNSSMSYPKKNQTVNMYADEALTESMKVDFKGWGVQKKHVYKANWIDLTHARNIVSAQLWGDVVKSRANYADLPELLRTSPNQGAIDGFPALVYANGVYQGRYTINIPKDGWMSNMDKTLDTHCILCGENYISGCFRAAANINGSDWSDELHDTVPDAIKTRWNEVISFVMNSTDDEFKASLSDYFYVDSLIDYLLFALASCGLDSMGKNQLYMTYDGQRWIASMYDMDSTWGLYWNGSSFVASDYARTSYEDYVSGRQGNLLYIRLEQNFYEEIQARWAELKAGPLSYENIMTRFERFIGIVPPHIVKEDYASTTGGGSFTGIPSQSTNHIQQIRAFALARQAWTNEYVAALTPVEEIPCTGITLDQNTLTFTAVGTQTLTATVIPENTTDTVVWSSDDAAIASVDGGVVTAKANGSTTIKATCGAYSVTCAVSVSGIEEAVIDYSHNPLADVVWSHGYTYDVNIGEKISSSNEHCSEKFELQNCKYNLTFGDGNSYIGLFVWDETGKYLGRSQNNKGSYSVWGMPGYKYALKVHRTSDNDMTGVTLLPVNNSSSAMSGSIDLATADGWQIETKGIRLAVDTYGLGATTYAQEIHSVNWQLFDISPDSTIFKSPDLLVIQTYGNIPYLYTTYFGADLDAAKSYFSGKPFVYSV